MAINRRILKDGTEHFYNGRKKITESEKRDLFKSNANTSFIDPNKLSKADRQLFGRIKGGVNRAATAARLENGQLIPKDIALAAKKMSVNIDKGLRETGFKSLKELEENKPKFFESLREYLKFGIVESEYSTEDTKTVIATYAGSDIVLNGEKVSKSEAKAAVSEFNQMVLQKIGSDAYNVYIIVKFKGTDEMQINLPDLEKVKEGMNMTEFNDQFGDMVKIYGSPTQ
jgi:hypothetical protein